MILWTVLDHVGLKLDGYEFDGHGKALNEKARAMVWSVEPYLSSDGCTGVMQCTHDHEWSFRPDGTLQTVSERSRETSPGSEK
jgi:hypothetical protein